MSESAGDLLQSIEIVTPADDPDGEAWESHAHERHELLSSITGIVTVETADRVHVLPRGSAIWIPAECAHAVRASAGNAMRCTWFAAAALPDALARPAVLSTSRLLDDVLVHLDEDLAPERRRRAEAFALDLLSLAARPEEGLPQPASPWLREVTAMLAADPGDGRSVEEWAAAAAVSVRTFTRHFRAETGLAFSSWRTRLRVRAAMAELAASTGVAVVARRVGFDSPSAFATAFRRETGSSPSAFAAGSRPA